MTPLYASLTLAPPSCADPLALKAHPEILSLETTTVPALTSLLTTISPDTILFSAGAGGKGDPSRTRAVDYEGALKVFDAMEAGNVKRLISVGAIDVRSGSGDGFPGYYDEESSEWCLRAERAEEELWKGRGGWGLGWWRSGLRVLMSGIREAE